jgi:HAE1 family hydrophobic/amphiphilic exporter-1
MLAYKISTDLVIQKLQEQNIEAAPGRIGEGSDKIIGSLQYVLTYTGKYSTVEEYENIPIKYNSDGEILRIKDIADVEFNTIYFDVETKYNGNPCAAIMIKQLPGSNAKTVINAIKSKMAELKRKTFLPGMEYDVSYDVSRFLDASIHEVVKTFIEAFILVSLVVFIFLQNWRLTLIPAIAVPVSLIGTFFFMQLFGFSLNLITLFALVLAIGIVIDNAIVVVEAVHAKLEHEKLTALQATLAAMKEISGPIVSITLVMSAVFIPTSFLSGPVGIFYKQFSITMAISIVLSGIGALTLTPALCALMLKDGHSTHSENKNILRRFFVYFNRIYSRLEFRYNTVLSNIIGKRVVTFGVVLVFSLGVFFINRFLPAGFIPNEDQGTFYASVTTPPGSTLERTKAAVNEIQLACLGLDAIESVSTMAGQNILTGGTGATYGTCLINLKPWQARAQTVDEVIAQVRERTKHIKDAKIEYFAPPAVPGYGSSSGVEFILLNKTGDDNPSKMHPVVNQFLKDIELRPETKNVFTIFDDRYPIYLLHFDIDKAAQKGISAQKAMETLQTQIGSEYATNFIKFGQMYKVMVQALPKYRAKPEDILKFYAENENGEMVPMSSFLTIEKVYGLERATRYNLYPTAEFFAEVAPGFSSGDAINAIQATAAEKLPKGYDISWAGITLDQVLAGNEAIYIFLICTVFVYLLLAAQYESFLLPFPILLSLPLGIFGSFLFLFMMGLENNIYAQIALIMLIGLLGKNAILIVEFANLKQKEGHSPVQAAIQGATIRLRPILMTSFAFIAGLVPLMFATGAGAVGNKTIGASAAGGMLIGTLFGVIIVPGLYVVFATISRYFTKEETLFE